MPFLKKYKQQIYIGTGILAVLIVVLILVGRKPRVDDVPPKPIPVYELPIRHDDDTKPEKDAFLDEQFIDLKGNPVSIRDFLGTPLIVVMYVSFLSNDGQKSIISIEALNKIRGGDFSVLIIPIEPADRIKPAVKKEFDNIRLLFRADGSGNLSLAEKYDSFFWDTGLITSDYPDDSVSRHLTSPFYWIIDKDGTIREKLIDYSNLRGVDVNEIAIVLEKLLGPPSGTSGDKNPEDKN